MHQSRFFIVLVHISLVSHSCEAFVARLIVVEDRYQRFYFVDWE